MKLLPLNKNYITLIIVATLTLGFFIAGLFKILDYLIIKVLLFSGFGVLLLIAIRSAFKNEFKKKRSEDKLQNDSH